MSQTAVDGRKRRVEIGLRSQHIHYLEYLAEQNGVSLSVAFSQIISRYAVTSSATRKPPRKRRQDVVLDSRHVALLDRLALEQGLFRADVARRLIDAAIAEDRMVGG